MRGQATAEALFVNIGLLIFLIPALILIVPGAGEILFGILAALGLAKTVKDRSNPLSRPGSRFLAVFCWTFFLAALLSVLASGPSLEGFSRLGTNIHFLLVPFAGILFLSTPNAAKHLFRGIKVGAILSGIIAFIQYELLSHGQLSMVGYPRPHGAVNAIVFGDIAILLGFLSMVSFFRESKKGKAVSALSFCLAVLAASLAEVRGAWVSAPVLSISLLIIWRLEGSLSLKRLATILVVLGIIGVLVNNSPVFQKRYRLAVGELSDIPTLTSDSSVSTRVVMWKAAWKTWFHSPLLGHGLHGTTTVVLPDVEFPDYKEPISSYSHLHNEYLNTLVGKGMLGCASLLLLLFGPIFVLRKHLRSSSESAYAAAGILVCIGYALFGLTNLAFGHGIMNTFYVFMLSIILTQVTLATVNKTAHSNTNEQNTDPIEPIYR